MNGALYIFFGTILVPMFIMAVCLLKGKGASLIAGYNTMSKEEKAKYDEKALCRFVGWLLMAIIFCMVFFPVATYFEITWLTYCGSALMLAVTIGGLIYANTGNRFRNAETTKTVYDEMIAAFSSR